MQPPPLSLNALFAPQTQFTVPLFQRPYVWNRDANWIPLWQDLKRIAERILAGQPVRAHFLGQVVLQLMQTPTPMGLMRREVIDGQQRLTTLQILLRAAQDALSQEETRDIAGLLAPLTRNLVVQSAHPDLAFKVWPTNSDRASFRAIMNASHSEESGLQIAHRLHEAYTFFRVQLEEWLAVGDSPNRVRALVETLQNRLLLIAIDLDTNDEAQVIFETLNGRGTPLLPSDLVKNWLLRQIERDGQGDVEALYEAHWRRFDEHQTHWREETGRGHAKRARLDHFLQDYLTMRRGKEATTAHLFSDFLEYALPANADQTDQAHSGANNLENPPEQTAVSILADISGTAQIFRTLTPQHGDPTAARVFGWLDILEIGTATPFLIRLFELCSSAIQARSDVLTDVESFVVRRLVCRHSTRAYNQVFVRLLNSLGSDPSHVHARVREALLRGTTSADRWPEDADFRHRLINQPIYGVHSSRRVNALLRALELGVRTEFMPQIPLPATLWIEHVMPQEWQAHWPIVEEQPAVPSEGGETRTEIRDRLIDTLGNLTLLTARMNQELSNSGWLNKRTWLREHGLLVAMNHHLFDLPDWTEARILARGTTLSDVALRLWPRPATLGP